MNWTEQERLIIKEACTWLDEAYEDTRKGIAQEFYVIEVKKYAEYLCHSSYVHKPVPKHLVGVYKMRYATDLNYLDYHEAIMKNEWVRCEQVEVVVKEWRNVDE